MGHGSRSGTDTLFDAKLAKRQGAQLGKLTRWYSSAAVLQQATIGNAELLALSGPRNPYPGRLGVVEEGAIADLILIDGDPVADISLVANPDVNFLRHCQERAVGQGNSRRRLSTATGTQPASGRKPPATRRDTE